MDDLAEAMQSQVAEGYEHAHAWETMFRDFYEERAATLLESMVNTHPDEQHLRESMYHQLTALNELKSHFMTKINTGKLAQQNLKEMNK